jgi:AraC-like DNA-binding protein
MTYFISHIQIANAVLCLLMAAQLFGMQALRSTPKRLLALNCLLYAHQSIAIAAILNGYGNSFMISRPMLAMLLGPTLYLYFVCLGRPDSKLLARDAGHFVVSLTIFLLLIAIKPLRFLIDFAIPLSFVVYTALIAWQIKSGKRALAHLGDYANSAYIWLRALLAMSIINILLELAVGLELANGTALRDSVSLLIASMAFFAIDAFMMYAALQRSHFLEWMYQFGVVDHPPEIATADNSEARTLFERWETLIRAEQLHKLEFGITLPQAARKLQVPARQLSNAVNQIYGKSFSTHLNDLRVQEAQDLLRIRSDLSIIDVMHEAGFSTKSNFNKEFLRVTGMSPSAYRDEHCSTQP